MINSADAIKTMKLYSDGLTQKPFDNQLFTHRIHDRFVICTFFNRQRLLQLTKQTEITVVLPSAGTEAKISFRIRVRSLSSMFSATAIPETFHPVAQSIV